MNTAHFYFKHSVTPQSVRDAIDCCPDYDSITLHYPGVKFTLKRDSA